MANKLKMMITEGCVKLGYHVKGWAINSNQKLEVHYVYKGIEYREGFSRTPHRPYESYHIEKVLRQNTSYSHGASFQKAKQIKTIIEKNIIDGLKSPGKTKEQLIFESQSAKRRQKEL